MSDLTPHRLPEGSSPDPSFIGRGFRWPMGVDHTGSLALTNGAEDLDRSIRVILATAPGERVMRREVTVGGGHAGGQLGWTHFGIGEDEVATVTVTWPDGEVGRPIEVDANTFSTIEHGATAPIPWRPAGG